MAFDCPSVFQDLVPSIQRNRGMVGVTDTALDIDARIRSQSGFAQDAGGGSSDASLVVVKTEMYMLP
jgi:hypothetical protein